MERRYIYGGGFIDYEPSFLSKEESDSLYNYIYAEASWELKYASNRKTGEKFSLSRLTAFYADDHPDLFLSYSGITHETNHWLPNLLDLKSKIEKVTGAQYNTCLANMYLTGSDYLSAHYDNYTLGVNPNIAMVSLGSTRAFVLSQYMENPAWKPESGIEIFEPENRTFQYNLPHGSLLIMGGTTQDYWTHEVPKMDNINSPRISLTFRKFII